MSEKLKLGVVGLGVGVTGHIPAARLEGFEVVALAARTADKLTEAADRLGVEGRYTDFEALLAHPGLDAVAITTPPAPHHDMVLKALDAGLHVMLEKPFALNTAEATEMRARAAASGRTAMIAHAFRHAPARAYVKSLIDEGYIGTLQGISMTFFVGPKEPPLPAPARSHWRLGMKTGGGFSTGQMSTFFDSIIDWFGPVKAINGRTIAPKPGALQADGSALDGDSGVTATFELANGAWGAISASSASPFGPGGRINILGSEGALEIVQPILVASDAETVSGGRFADGPQIRPLEIPPAFILPTLENDPKPAIYRAYRKLYLDFSAGIGAGTSPAPNFDDAYQLQRISDALHESNATGAWVNV
ncbi:Gfo/Idh/MocA family protein [Phenylobacterium immobile]|uniref:Gfo/Idh/MocA family protein n=1 Tax=Phenylobacterium immobile TaxID=21 RepID=UPI000B1F3597|nr:Gfo/Idh/MocA family oxidoreductase [Phenylobacterium immobile]